MLNCFYSLLFNVSAAGLYQENKTQTNFTLLLQSVLKSINVFNVSHLVL